MRANPERFKDVREEMRTLAQTKLFFLCTVLLGYDKLVPRIHGPMCAFAEAPPSQFTLLMAFRSGYKSTIATEAHTVQLQLQRPQDVLIYSEASTMAEYWSLNARRKAFENNQLMDWLFPELANAESKANMWGASEWHLPHGGRVIAAGIDSKLMGAHVDEIIMDDIFSDPKADKGVEFAERVIHWVTMSISLLKIAGEGKRRLIGVPWWVVGDVYAHYRQILPRAHQFIMPLMRQGECIWPENFPPQLIAELQSTPVTWASQYLLNPISSDTALFKGTEFTLYDRLPVQPYTKCMTVDPAFSKMRRSHKTGLGVGYLDARGHMWVDRAEEVKCDARDTHKFVLQSLMRERPSVFGLESGGPQRAFFQGIQDELRRFPLSHPLSRVRIVELKPVHDKIARLSQLSNACANGTVKIRRALTALTSQLCLVTGAEHEQNDMADSVAHLIDPAILAACRPFASQPDGRKPNWLPMALWEADPWAEAPGETWRSA